MKKPKQGYYVVAYNNFKEPYIYRSTDSRYDINERGHLFFYTLKAAKIHIIDHCDFLIRVQKEHMERFKYMKESQVIGAKP